MKKGLILLALTVAVTSVNYAQESGEPPFGMSHIAAYSIFTEAVRNNDHEMALQFGEWMLVAQPREMEGVTTFRLDRQFERLIGVYTALAEEESDPTEKRKHLEEADAIFDLTFEIFEEDEIDVFRWTHNRGRFYQDHFATLRISIDEAFAWYEKAFELNPEQFSESGGGYFAGILLSHYVSSGQRDKAMAMIDEIEDIASAELQQEIDRLREELFESPEERITFLESRLDRAEGEEREVMMIGLVDLYDETGQSEKAASMARELYEMNPGFENTRRLADLYLAEGNSSEAIRYLNELVERTDDSRVKGGILLELAEAHQQIGELPNARRFARRAVNEEGHRGEAFMRISSIYAAAVSQCTGGQALDRDDRTVYWLILDYLERAIEADPALRSTAQNRIDTFKSAMPSAEDKFFRGWETGDTFRINSSIGECYAWIDEETRVR
jgi:tetratricopeptide (TPR) repeat protein